MAPKATAPGTKRKASPTKKEAGSSSSQPAETKRASKKQKTESGAAAITATAPAKTDGKEKRRTRAAEASKVLSTQQMRMLLDKGAEPVIVGSILRMNTLAAKGLGRPRAVEKDKDGNPKPSLPEMIAAKREHNKEEMKKPLKKVKGNVYPPGHKKAGQPKPVIHHIHRFGLLHYGDTVRKPNEVLKNGKTVPLLDEDGKPVLDANGQPRVQMTERPDHNLNACTTAGVYLADDMANKLAIVAAETTDGVVKNVADVAKVFMNDNGYWPHVVTYMLEAENAAVKATTELMSKVNETMPKVKGEGATAASSKKEKADE